MSEPEPSPRRPPLRVLLTVLAVAIPLAVIAVAVALSGGGGTVGQTSAADGSHFVPAAAAQTSTSRTTSASTTSARPAAPGLKLPGGSGALVAQLTRSTALRARPHGPMLGRLSTKTEFGSPQVLWVQRRSGHWLGVASPTAGNNRVGWIEASAASLSRVTWQLRVSLSARRLTVLNHGRVAQRYTVAVGAPSAPTPTGHFAVTDRLLTGTPTGPYGCCILALSATAPHAIQDWSGGNRIAIHSTPETSSIGEAVSHGCMRLTLAEGRWLIAHVPLGTPTVITS
jgi:lipoprotein-anchoring transpeptidase ErfK/SrfK